MTTLVKHPAHTLPAVDPRPTCTVCGATGRDVATRPYCAGTADVCDRCDAATPEQRREQLAAMWLRLVDEHRTGAATDDHVFGVLTGLRPDIHPHRRWVLYEHLEDALHVAKRVAESTGAHRDLGLPTHEDAEEYAAARVAEALDELIGGAR